MGEPLQFGRYTVKGLLGRGTMGIVYCAEDPVISRQVAIKVVHVAAGSTDEDTAEFQRRFEREFRAAGTLSHPGIVTVYDVGQENDEVFMAMEFVEGKNVEEQLGSGVEFSTEQVADLADQIGSALDYAHSQDVVHRDVKPANIMAASDGRFKLADFGVAKFQSGTLTKGGALIGTPSFMSPEQALGKTVTGASDQFSLGVVVYRLLTGQRPFTGESMTAVMYQISQVDPPSPSVLDPRLPAGVSRVVMRALSKNPGERFSSCQDFASALKAAVAGGEDLDLNSSLDETTLATGLRQPEVVARPRRSGAIAIGITAGLVLAIASTWMAWTSGVFGPSLIEAAMAVDSNPPGQALAVWLNDRPIGLTTPGDVPLAGEEGQVVRLDLRREDAVVASTTITLGADLSGSWVPDVAVPVVPVRYEVRSEPPGARVLQDGLEIAPSTPFDVDLLPGQSYEITVELEGFEPSETRLVDPAVDDETLLLFPLDRIVRQARLRGTTAVPVIVVAQPTGRGNPRRARASTSPSLNLPAGSYTVTITAPEIYWSHEYAVSLVEGEVSTLPALPRTAEVTVFDRPGNATVQIDDFEAIPTGGATVKVAIGPHRFLFEWPSGKQHTESIQITQDRRVGAREP